MMEQFNQSMKHTGNADQNQSQSAAAEEEKKEASPAIER